MQSGKKLDMDRVVARMQAATSLVVASIQDYQEITPDLYKVVVAFNTFESDKKERFDALAKLFNGAARPIENSFRVIAGAKSPAVVGFIARNVEVRPYEAAAATKYRALASNLLMDETDDTLWQVHAAGEDKYLARHSEESLGELVSLASLRQEHYRYDLPRLVHIASTDIQTNEYIAYVNPTTLEISHGYVVAALDGDSEGTLPVMDSETQERVNINPETVVESAFLNGGDVEHIKRTKQVAVTYSPDSWNAAEMKAYYKQVFSYAPEYLKEIEKIIDSHSVV